MKCPKWKIKYESTRKTLRQVILSNMKLREQNEKMRKAIKYYFSVIKEVNGEDWNDKPDHVLSKLIEALTPSKGQK